MYLLCQQVFFAQLADTNSGNRPVLSYDASGALTETKLRAMLQEVFLYGNPNAIWVSPTNKQTINGFNMANSSLIVKHPAY